MGGEYTPRNAKRNFNGEFKISKISLGSRTVRAVASTSGSRFFLIPASSILSAQTEDAAAQNLSCAMA
jgi:hypothetical protein